MNVEFCGYLGKFSLRNLGACVASVDALLVLLIPNTTANYTNTYTVLMHC